MKAKYDKAEANISKICKTLEGYQVQLMKDAALLDKMYQQNLEYYKELNLYIAARKKEDRGCKDKRLPEMIKKAETSGFPEDIQAAKDLESLCVRFRKESS